jgi:hypothetical protein
LLREGRIDEYYDARGRLLLFLVISHLCAPSILDVSRLLRATFFSLGLLENEAWDCRSGLRL